VTLLEPSQGPEELCVAAVVLLLLFVSVCFLVPRTVPACSFYSLKEVQCYKMLVCGAILERERAEASGGPYPMASWPALWRHGVGTSGTAATCQAWAPLLREWSLSFGIIATCPVIPGPVAGVAYLSLEFDLA
jgi:hypothetical protein